MPYLFLLIICVSSCHQRDLIFAFVNSMVNTRGRRDDPESSNVAPDRTQQPPPPMTLADAIAVLIASSTEQTELLRLLAQNGNRQRGHQEQGRPATTYGYFLVTHPPIFSDAEEPVEADNWLRVIESKFGLLPCTEVQKPLFVAQQLRGAASAWWTNYLVLVPKAHQVTWTEFRSAF